MGGARDLTPSTLSHARKVCVCASLPCPPPFPAPLTPRTRAEGTANPHTPPRAEPRLALSNRAAAAGRDEDRFGLEYDLDVYNIVAVSDFNMGGGSGRERGVMFIDY